MNDITNIIDLVAEGMIRPKTDFSETVESELEKIYWTTLEALRNIVSDGCKTFHKMDNFSENEQSHDDSECQELDKHSHDHTDCQPLNT
jgi:hypothetical protein